ncbi:UDP diphosphate synthase [Sulfolobales archaeon HS-7]|nr:UDP diphosphate synthase [Sulfolobales archaeon HS-7]
MYDLSCDYIYKRVVYRNSGKSPEQIRMIYLNSIISTNVGRGMQRGSILDAMNGIAYKVYKKRLWDEISNGPMPKHVGIIPDGNRRWARNNDASLDEAYEIGYLKVKQVMYWLLDLGIRNVTIFTLSSENCTKRSAEELRIILGYVKRGLEDLINDQIIYKNNIKVKVIGDITVLPENLVSTINDITNKTEHYKERLLTLAICYGGRQEIIDVVKHLAVEYKEGKITLDQINEEIIRKHLYLNEVDDIDLVIRTAGEIRISNFLLWHIAYSELYFCDVNWPDFRDIDLWRAIRSYQKRKRNFGK